MWKYYNYVSSSSKVLCDKTFDYVNYYTGMGPDSSSESDDKNDQDTLEDYIGVLKIELYENESESTRIYPAVGIYNEYAMFWSHPTHAIDNIYLGSAFNAASYDTLKDLNIKMIINATTEISNYYENSEEFKYLRYKLYDNNKHSIKKYLEKSFGDIKSFQQTNSGNILIHCFMGASRSASIVLYYLMRTKHYSFDDAIAYLKNKRITVNPTFRLTKDLASSTMPTQKVDF